MERKTILAGVIAGAMGLALAYQTVRINRLASRLARIERRALDQAAADGTDAHVRERLERANERSKAERRERWKGVWRESLLVEITAFAAENGINQDQAVEIADILDEHGEANRARWEAVHDGDVPIKQARQETDAARAALNAKMTARIGAEAWQKLDRRLNPDRLERPERPERRERPERLERPDRPERPRRR